MKLLSTLPTVTEDIQKICHTVHMSLNFINPSQRRLPTILGGAKLMRSDLERHRSINGAATVKVPCYPGSRVSFEAL